MMMKLSSTMPSAGRVHAKPVNARMLSVLRVSAPAECQPERHDQPEKPVISKSVSDAQEYPVIREILSSKLQGLQRSVGYGPRKATVMTTGVNQVNKALLRKQCANSKPRCTGLDMDIAWEALAHNNQTLQGVAKVFLDPLTDRLAVTDIQRVAESDAAHTSGTESTVPPDVEMAVRSMDSIIMEQLNDFMWQVENGELPAGSFQEEDAAASRDGSVDEQEEWPGQWEALASRTTL